MNIDLVDHPHIRKLLENMAFDNGTPKDHFFKHFDEVKDDFDLPRLDALADFAILSDVFDVITSEEAWEACPHGKPEDNNGPLWIQLTAGSGEINDVIGTHGDWAYMNRFLDSVFDGETYPVDYRDSAPPKMK